MKSRTLGLTTLFIITVFLGISHITACTPVATPPPAPDRDRDRDRDTPREPRYTDRRTGECGKDRKCEELCDDMFRSRKDRDECEEFSIADVKRMNDVFDVLDKPNADDLEALDIKDLDMLLSISSKPLETAVGRMNQSEKKKFLVWMAEDSEAAQTIEGAEDDYSILKELFGSSKTNIITELNKSIDSGDSFVEIILKEGNDVAVGWIDDFFGDQCDSNSNYEKCVFKDYYCALSLDNDAEEEYFEHDFFIDLLDEILSEERKTSGAPSWWDADTEAEDLDSWQSSPHNVCTNMKT